ncbi:sigma-70 family RNA polymerase sigma factor [Anthocerotibacter panamensis]|uniref:sigma-70 family RNA polymerase sigma factor n=1 Tax=Anthocerotibacter panamensis TaxID=2857077 RepID=UPI001C4055FB|nr:sigma-70 family RNA polymerase sigma factor [Anthocerotibacter panamensis]
MECNGKLPDSELFALCKRGQQRALGDLYHRYRVYVFHLSCRILHNPTEAEDLTQEVFLALWRSNFDPRRGSLKGYLTVLTRSRAIDRLRARGTATKFMERFQQTLVIEDCTNTLNDAMLEESCCTVRHALTQLPVRQRQVLEMAYFGGFSQAKIAVTTQTPLGTVKSWTRQGLSTLRQHLAAQVG